MFRCAAPDLVHDIAVSTNILRLCRCFNELVFYTKRGAAYPEYLSLNNASINPKVRSTEILKITIIMILVGNLIFRCAAPDFLR